MAAPIFIYNKIKKVQADITPPRMPRLVFHVCSLSAQLVDVQAAQRAY